MKLIKGLAATILLSLCFFSSSASLAETVKPKTEAVAVKAGGESEMAGQGQHETVVNKVNINTATAIELQKGLVGIGAKKAEAIVQYREKHGAFTAADQLAEVQGIGKAILEKNQERIIL